MSIVVVEDEAHTEWQGKFPSIKDAIAELRLRADIPWDQRPNVCPCTNWKNCGRRYEVIEYDDETLPWREMRRYPVLNISASGVFWSYGLQELDTE